MRGAVSMLPIPTHSVDATGCQFAVLGDIESHLLKDRLQYDPLDSVLSLLLLAFC